MSQVGSAIGALGALGIESYQISQGQQVSTTIGPGGVSEITSGAATTQQSVLFIVLGLGLLVLLVYLLK